MKAGFARATLAATILLLPLSIAAPRAEVAELHMATQYGIGTLAMVLVEKNCWKNTSRRPDFNRQR